MMLPRIFVDIETTHLEPHVGEIIEICIIREFPSGRVDMYHRKIKPVHIQTADPAALKINHYDPEKWNDAKTWRELAPEIQNLLSFGVIIGHNVTFDWTWLSHHIRRATNQRISHYKIDTQTLAWEHLPAIGISLKAIRSFFGWSHAGQHTAPVDCHDCRRLFHLLFRASYVQRQYWKFKHWIMKQNQ